MRKHRISRRGLLAAGLSAPFVASCTPGKPGAGKRPDIVVFLADDQNYESILGRDLFYRTPNINRLAADGIAFQDSYVTTSICPVSRACIITGQHAETHRHISWATPIRKESYANIFPALLREAGYNVAFVGKWGIANAAKPEDFTDYLGFEGQGRYFEGSDRKLHLTQRLTNQTVKLIDKYAKDDAPFCIIVSYKAPHGQDDLPLQEAVDMSLVYPEFDVQLLPESYGRWNSFALLPEFLQNSFGRHHYKTFIEGRKYRSYMEAYRKLIWGLDRSVGQIVGFYKSKRPYEQLEAYYLADNGMMTGQHGMFGKWLMYEDSIRIPIVWKPAFGAIPPEGARRHMALNIDIAPSVLHAAQVAIPDAYQGMAFQSLEKREPRSGFFYSFYVTHENRIPVVLGYKDHAFKYATYPMHGDYEQLFASDDENEIRNLAGDKRYAAILERYRIRTRVEREKLGPLVRSA